MAKMIINCIGCERDFFKGDCTKVYSGQKGMRYCCPQCLEERRHKVATRMATNEATEKTTSSFYTLTFTVLKPNDSIVAWLESLGYSVSYDNFGRVDFKGSEVEGFQSITKMIASYNKRFTEPYTMAVKCRDRRDNELTVNSLEMVRLFSKYKGYEKCLKEMGLI